MLTVINYKFEADKLDFKTNRYINAHIDYTERIVNNVKYHRCFKLKNNKLINYKNLLIMELYHLMIIKHMI